MSEMRFDGKVAVITGAGRGLGRGYAELLAARGASIVVNDLGCSSFGSGAAVNVADEVVDGIRQRGGQAVANHASVDTEAGAHSIVQSALVAFGRVDIVINNAGIQHPQPFDELPLDVYRKVMDVHFFGTVMVTQAAWPHLVAQGYGRIVNTVSTTIYGLPYWSAYASAKGALFAFTRTLAQEVPAGIRVNAISPGAGTRMAGESGVDAAVVAHLQTAFPPAAVAPTVAYLAHESCTLNGETLGSGGGATTRWLVGETAPVTPASLTPESVRENLATICDPSGFTAFGNTMEHVNRARAGR
ncbi:MAG: SDR family NAD(P)-dependent oxidoreductase [Steroidobacteraceae bacterium]